MVLPMALWQLPPEAQAGVKKCHQVADSMELFPISTQPVDNFVGNLPKPKLTA
jgi:hypothetical protein